MMQWWRRKKLGLVRWLLRNTGFAVVWEEAGKTHTLNQLARMCHQDNIRWWQDPATGAPIERNKGELFMLMVTELAEAVEGLRKNRMDDKLPHRRQEEVEMADAFIRMFDYAGGYGLDLDGAFWEKRQFNSVRPDHRPENRLKADGKKF